jgi:hypothetical protein
MTIKNEYYNGYHNWQTWSAMVSMQKKPVSTIAERPEVSSFDKLLEHVLQLQSETDHGVEWVDRKIHVKTINKALSEWSCFN